MEKQHNILIVEDEVVIAMDLQNSLEKFNYNVIDHVINGEDVIFSIQKNRPDLILMDIKLAGKVDGVDTAQMIYDNYDIPVIFITSYSNKEIVERAKKTNPFGYLVKPFEDKELFTNIEIALYKHGAEARLRDSERKYRELSESIQQIVIECDLDGKISYLNQSGMEMLSISPKDINQGVLLEEFMENGHFEDVKRKIANGETNSTSISKKEYSLLSKSGRKLIVEEFLVPLYKNSTLIGFRGILVDVTEIKYLISKIRESQQRFRQIADTIDTAFWIVSCKDKSIQFANPAVIAIFGSNIKTFSRGLHSLRDLIHPDDRKHVLAEFNIGLKHENYNIHYRIIDENGSVKWINEFGSVIKETGNANISIACFASDETKKKEVELNLIQSEQEKKHILMAMSDSIITINKKGYILNSFIKGNESGMIFLNLKRLLGHSLKKVFKKEIYNVLIEKTKECFEQNKTVQYLFEEKIDGENHWFETRIAPINQDSALLIIRNVTQSKQNTLELQKYFNIIEQTKELIMITDSDGLIEYVNPTFLETTGYELKDLLGRRPNVVSSGKHPESFFESLWSTVLSGRSFKSEFINLKKTGEEYIEEKIITPVKNEQGQILNFISTGRDITEERKREKKMRAYQKFEKILEKKEQKYRTLSLIQGQENERKRIAREIHDGLGQMLTVAMANLESLSIVNGKEEKEKIKLTKQMISEIIQESRKISHNLSPGGLYEFGLFPVIKQLVDRINGSKKQNCVLFGSNIKGMRFKNEVEINLYRIIQEGLQNALKHSKAKTIQIEINYFKDKLNMIIKDNGIGINLKNFEDTRRHYNGIKNMEERAKIIDANLKISSQLNNGLEIQIELKAKPKK